jgi:hypothetical protein
MKPYIRALVETFVGAEIIRIYNIPHKNRLGLILIDSAFETACRIFLQYVENIKLTDAHTNRETLMKTMKSKLTDVDKEVWDSINFFYEEIRNDFYHQSSTKTITDNSYTDYKDIIEFVLNRAFKITLRELVDAELTKVQEELKKENEHNSVVETDIDLVLSQIKDRVDKTLVAVFKLSPQKASEVNDFFKVEGEKYRLKDEEFLNIVGRNSGSKKFFYFDREQKKWRISKLGKTRLDQLKSEQNGK